MTFNEALRKALVQRETWGTPLWIAFDSRHGRFALRRKGELKQGEEVILTLYAQQLARLAIVQDQVPERFDEVVTAMLKRVCRGR